MTSFPSPMHSATALKISLSPFLSSCPPMMMRGPCRSVMVHQSLEFLCLQRAARLVEPTSSDCHGKMSAVVGNANAALAIDHDHASFSAGPFKPFNCALSRSEEHTSELQSLMRISYAVFCLKKKNHINQQ